MLLRDADLVTGCPRTIRIREKEANLYYAIDMDRSYGFGLHRSSTIWPYIHYNPHLGHSDHLVPRGH
jgi:hypothetical protein